MKYSRNRLVAFLIIAMMLISLFSLFSQSSYADWDLSALLSNISTMGGSLSTDTADASDEAIFKYAKAGMFGEACMVKANASGSTAISIKTESACSAASNYQTENSQYSAYAASQLRTNDKNSGRLNAAMEAFNENAHFVYSFMTGFGCLSSLLVFILIFVRITWLPEHALQRRKAMEDILVAGISTILLGGFWLVVSVFQAMFSRFWTTYTVFSKDWKHAGNAILAEYKTLIIGVLGIATLTAILMFIKSITSIVISGAGDTRKSEKMIQVLYCGLASAGLGAITIFAGFFWNVLK